MKGTQILLGNDAIAYGVLASGASVVASYPGTPASEICETAYRVSKQEGLQVHVEWSINEKTAFEVAYANAIAGRRSAVSMKQVGLNVASDPVMSAAYMGTVGGILLIVADDPGPHSSQTEQDTRLFAMFAKLPVLDPSSPEEALRMAGDAFAFSEEFRTPVILRPTTRVCHARQVMEVPALNPEIPAPDFRRDPARWAATPGPRLTLHRELNERIARIRKHDWAKPRLVLGDRKAPVAVVSSGVSHSYLLDVLKGFDRWPGVCLYKVDMPYPMDPTELDRIARRHKCVLVVEESEPVIELQFTSRANVRGRIDGTVPSEGELNPEIIMDLLDGVTGRKCARGHFAPPKGRRPSLCAG
ncbi:MAG TPA: indolepyruvate oxidoreductase, partial [Deltaproteobacteria bacterium]|nr:indolepyruvate oxidoreductase [Deltaproteobacteria bacterium]